MTDLVVLHSAYGLTPGVRAVADALGAPGRRVHAPDYYDGHVFTDEAEGIGHRDEIGYQALFDRVRGEVDGLPPETSFIGFSLGASFAHRLVAERHRMGGLILVGNTNPVKGAWPGVPVQVHRFEHDTWVRPADVADLRAVVEESDASFEDHVQPGRGHLFTELHLPEYSADLVDVMLVRVRGLLDRR